MRTQDRDIELIKQINLNIGVEAGHLIKRIRNERGLTQDDLARKSQASSRQTIVSWEQRGGVMRLDTLIQLCDALGITVCDFFKLLSK